ncbi:hypothetical protein X907_1211 [Glycocaulis alkaliphilus]|uniref:Uncharacterized protein n=1 Tax=Glycocaulis alkaliphilus TaxID=1434191 RepID=A0A3T0E971_9PROT|nr:type II toxin-antitoxin system HicA family toxin [Glycocaulis alkaliphilus]AZU03746.1 hypothetical protein X907_1211 [Glycocaulis alkaliphilus]GGB83627.1 hypothetical protein GCM10007417_24490 [Glycocaulis alkaliphilus]
MNNKHQRTLKAVFDTPTRSGIDWSDIEKLFLAAGCERIEGAGSRVKFVKDGRIASFHRPHPDRHAKRYQVEDARRYFRLLGIEP